MFTLTEALSIVFGCIVSGGVNWWGFKKLWRHPAGDHIPLANCWQCDCQRCLEKREVEREARRPIPPTPIGPGVIVAENLKPNGFKTKQGARWVLDCAKPSDRFVCYYCHELGYMSNATVDRFMRYPGERESRYFHPQCFEDRRSHDNTDLQFNPAQYIHDRYAPSLANQGEEESTS